MDIRVHKLFRRTFTFQIHAFFLQIHKEMLFFEEFAFVKVLIELQMRHVTQNTRIS